MVEIHRNSKMWELLNIFPLTELDQTTPKERAELHRKSVKELEQEERFQTRLNKPVSEFFRELSTKTPSE